MTLPDTEPLDEGKTDDGLAGDRPADEVAPDGGATGEGDQAPSLADLTAEARARYEQRRREELQDIAKKPLPPGGGARALHFVANVIRRAKRPPNRPDFQPKEADLPKD